MTQKRNRLEFDKMGLKENGLEELEEKSVPEENPMVKKRWFGRGIYRCV